MSQTKSFWEHPIDKLEEALSIRKQISALQDKVNTLLGNEVTSAATKLVKVVKKRTRTMSAEARERIAAAQRARWAKAKRTVSAPKAAKASKKRGLTPEGRARLAAAMKARWAARKKGAPALNAPKKAKMK